MPIPGIKARSAKKYPGQISLASLKEEFSNEEIRDLIASKAIVKVGKGEYRTNEAVIKKVVDSRSGKASVKNAEKMYEGPPANAPKAKEPAKPSPYYEESPYYAEKKGGGATTAAATAASAAPVGGRAKGAAKSTYGRASVMGKRAKALLAKGTMGGEKKLARSAAARGLSMARGIKGAKLAGGGLAALAIMAALDAMYGLTVGGRNEEEEKIRGLEQATSQFNLEDLDAIDEGDALNQQFADMVGDEAGGGLGRLMEARDEGELRTLVRGQEESIGKMSEPYQPLNGFDFLRG